MNPSLELTFIDEKPSALQSALTRTPAEYAVELTNVGNPDRRQYPDRPLPDTVCGWAQADSLAECSRLCRLYIAFYELGGGNWSGGTVTRHQAVIGRVAYNGRIFGPIHGAEAVKPEPQLPRTEKEECIYEPKR